MLEVITLPTAPQPLPRDPSYLHLINVYPENTHLLCNGKYSSHGSSHQACMVPTYRLAIGKYHRKTGPQFDWFGFRSFTEYKNSFLSCLEESNPVKLGPAVKCYLLPLSRLFFGLSFSVHRPSICKSDPYLDT